MICGEEFEEYIYIKTYIDIYTRLINYALRHRLGTLALLIIEQGTLKMD